MVYDFHPILKTIVYLLIQLPILLLISGGLKHLKKWVKVDRDSFPGLLFGLFVQITLIISVFVPGGFTLYYLNGMDFYQLGFRFYSSWANELLMGLMIGSLVGVIVCGFYVASNYLSIMGWNQHRYRIPAYFFMQAITLFCSAVFEEALFRGYFFQEIGRWAGQIIPLTLTTLVFGIMHWLINRKGTYFGAVGAGLAGGVLYLAYIKTNALWLSTGIHWGWNIAIGLIFSIPVSGDVFSGRLFRTKICGHEWMTGGDFGPEAGLPGILAFLFIGCLIIYFF